MLSAPYSGCFCKVRKSQRMLPYQDAADKAGDQILGRWDLGMPGASSTGRNKR